MKHLPNQLLEIEALRSVADKLGLGGILSALVDDQAINQSDLDKMSFYGDPVEGLHEIIGLAKNRSDIQLIHYSWTILPTRETTIEIITNKSRRVFKV